jgi:hypothetical protein
MSEEQQDDHIWLTVGETAWAIKSIKWPIIILWRGYHPLLEYNIIDISRVNWEDYHKRWLEMNEVANVG